MSENLDPGLQRQVDKVRRWAITLQSIGQKENAEMLHQAADKMGREKDAELAVRLRSFALFVVYQPDCLFLAEAANLASAWLEPVET
jgi:hypothetical protein